MSFITNRRKTAAGVAGLLLLAFPLAACGSDSSSDSSSSSSDKVSAQVELTDLSNGVSTAVKLDPGFLKAITGLGLTPAPTRDAKLTDGSLIFPITGGNVSLFKPGTVPNYVVGQIQHEGSGLSLTAGDTTVEIGNFNVDPGVSLVYGDVAVNGTLAVSSVPIFRLDGSSLMPVQTEGNNAILEGTKVYISETAAGLLNDTFGTDKVTDQLLVGVAKITVATK